MKFQFRLNSLLLFMAAVTVYITSYKLLLDPIIIVEIGGHGMVVKGSRGPHFRMINPILSLVYYPAVLVDRKMRPRYWNEYSDYDPMIPFPAQSMDFGERKRMRLPPE